MASFRFCAYGSLENGKNQIGFYSPKVGGVSLFFIFKGSIKVKTLLWILKPDGLLHRYFVVLVFSSHANDERMHVLENIISENKCIKWFKCGGISSLFSGMVFFVWMVSVTIEIDDAASIDVSLTPRAVERWPNLNIIIS